ncbi:MAG: damage repair protein [Bacilli bacterium]
MSRFNYYLAIDLKSFYAAVECVLRGLDPFATPLAVCDESRGKGSIVLAVSPYLRSLGVPARLRKFELPPLKDLILATPQMATYLTYSAHFNRILLEFVGEDDLHIYSIDESFINIGPYLKLYKKTPDEIALEILQRIKEKLSIPATIGLGPNMFLAKIAMDIEAKKRPNGIAHWRLCDVPTKLWPLTPLNKMWGISRGLQRRLNNLGITSVGDLAAYPKTALKSRLGIIGETLWEHANGIDHTDIRDKYIPQTTSLNNGQVLDRDYTYQEIFQIVREMNDDLARRLRKRQALTERVGVTLVFASGLRTNFSRSQTLLIPSDDNEEILQVLHNLLRSEKLEIPIRGVYLHYGRLKSNVCRQLSLFYDERKVAKKRAFQQALDQITNRFGLNAILRLDALNNVSTAKRRHEQIGGHRR